RVDQAAGVLGGAGAATALGVAGIGAALAGVVRNVDGDVVFGGEVGQHLRHVVDRAVGVLVDRVRLHERVEADDIDPPVNDDALQGVGQVAALDAALGIELHQLAGGGSRCGQKQPTLQFAAIDPVVQRCR